MPPSSLFENIALLIDADNAPAARISFIIAELASYGVVNIRRAYGNWKKPTLAGWEKVLHEFAIQPIQQFDLVKGKNAADMALLIDAMDILYTKSVGAFCLVSSDCDFTPLVHRLRADGKQVIGFGGKSSAEPFVNSCTRFLYLDEDESPKPALVSDPAPDPVRLPLDDKLKVMLKNAVTALSAEDGWSSLAGVGSHISNQGSFDCRNYGFTKLSDLFAAIDSFELKKTPGPSGTVFSVRIRK
ncbi:MAG TPA: NYN domain-containing protein [Verrucomicrobiales bacterium]|nr:NYN domain-containing protein [Verrucomicrobiales bacterium]